MKMWYGDGKNADISAVRLFRRQILRIGFCHQGAGHRKQDGVIRKTGGFWAGGTLQAVPGLMPWFHPLIQRYDQGGTQGQPAGQREEGSHRRCQQDLSAQIRMTAETFGQNDRNDGGGNGCLDDDDALDIIIHWQEISHQEQQRGGQPQARQQAANDGFGFPFHVMPQIPHGTAEQNQAEGSGAVADHFKSLHQGRLGYIGSQTGPGKSQAHDNGQQGAAEENAHIQIARATRDDDDANAPDDQLTPHIVDEKDAQRGIVAGGKQHLDDGNDEKSVVLHSRRQGERTKARADAHAQHFRDQPCGRDAQQKFQGPGCDGLEGKGNAAERLISGEHHVLHDAVKDETGVGHIHRDAHDGRVMVCLDDLLVAQIETRGKEKVNGNGGKKGGEDDGAGVHGRNQIRIKSGFWIVCRIAGFIANINSVSITGHWMFFNSIELVKVF